MEKIFRSINWSSCFIGLFTIFCSLIFATSALSREYTIEIQFSFDTQAVPGNPVSEFYIYKSGERICESDAAASIDQTIVCSFESPAGLFPFTMTAVYDDGTQSPHSAPFSFSLVDESMVIRGLETLSGQASPEIEGIGEQSGTDQVEMGDVIEMLRELQ